MENEEWRNEVRRPEGKPMKNEGTTFDRRTLFLQFLMKIKTTSSDCIYYPNTPLKEPAFNCSFVHKGSVLPQYSYWITPVLLLKYSSTPYWITPVLALKYSSTPYWITPVLALDYSSTCIGLLQYLHWITPVLLLDYSSTPIGTLALGKGVKVHIDVLPLGVLLVWQSLEVGKEISFQLLFIEEVVPLVDDSLEATAAYRLGFLPEKWGSEGVRVKICPHPCPHPWNPDK